MSVFTDLGSENEITKIRMNAKRHCIFIYKKTSTIKASLYSDKRKVYPPPKKKKIYKKINIKMYIMIKSNRIPRGEEAG